MPLVSRLLFICLFFEILFVHYSILGLLHGRGITQLVVILIFSLMISQRLVFTNPGLSFRLYFFLIVYTIFQQIYYESPRFLEYLIKGPILSLLIYYMVFTILVRKESDAAIEQEISKFFRFFIILVVISNLVAIGQFIGLDIFWQMRSFSITEFRDGGVSTAIIERHRPVGLAVNSVELGYQSVLALPLLFFDKGIRNRNLLIFLLIIGNVACGNRSSFFLMMGFLIYVAPSNYRILVSFLVVALVFLSVILEERLITLDSSALGKIWIIYFGLIYFFNNPLGSGLTLADFLEFKKGFNMGSISLNSEIIIQLEKYTPHNQVVNTAVIYGVLGLVLLAVLLYHLFLRKLEWKKTADQFRLLKSLQIAVFLYFLNSFVHNAGFFVLDVVIWYFLPIFDFLMRKYNTLDDKPRLTE